MERTYRYIVVREVINRSSWTETYHKLSISVDGSSSEGNVLPGDDDDVLRVEDGGSHDAFSDVPLEALPYLHPELVLTGRQVTLQSGEH